jgi:hypothetical protein
MAKWPNQPPIYCLPAINWLERETDHSTSIWCLRLETLSFPSTHPLRLLGAVFTHKDKFSSFIYENSEAAVAQAV